MENKNFMTVDEVAQELNVSNEYLYEVDEACYQRMELLVEQIKTGAGITEELKVSDQMKWVGLMNNVRSGAEEAVIRELIYV